VRIASVLFSSNFKTAIFGESPGGGRRPCQFRRLPRDLVATSSSRRWGDQLPLRVETCQAMRNPSAMAPPCSSSRLPRSHRRCRASSTRSGNLLAAWPMGVSIAARLGAQLACPAPLRDLEPCSERATGGYPALSCELDPSKRSKPVQLSLLPKPPPSSNKGGWRLSLPAAMGTNRLRCGRHGGTKASRHDAPIPTTSARSVNPLVGHRVVPLGGDGLIRRRRVTSHALRNLDAVTQCYYHPH